MYIYITYPHIKFDILICDSLHIEADCGGGAHRFAHF